MRRVQDFYRSRTKVQIAVAVGAIAAAGSAAYGHGAPASSPARNKPSPDEIATYEAARPAFEQHCFRCHTSAGRKSKRKALNHVAMDRYPFGGHHAGDAGQVIRKVLGADGKSKATMPSDDPGAVTGEDLRRILAWADAFDRAHASKQPNTDKETPHAH